MINRAKGFTLIELMVVVAIIGIISAIAFPSYDSYMKKGRRADAKTALTKIVDRQERHYLQNNTYSSTLTAINVGTESDDKYYKLEILSGTTKGFKAKATAQGAQLADTNCKSFEIDGIGAKTSNAGVDDANNCW